MIITDATRLPRLMQCFGSRNMPVVLPTNDDDTKDRDEGNAAHYMAQQIFQGKSIDELIDKRAYNGIIMDSEMARHVASYVSALDCGEVEIDTSHRCERWEIGGRADHISYRCEAVEPMFTVLTVDDFKYGHRLVEPTMNWTLISHAIGYCLQKQIQPTKIILRIHQPRRYHPAGTLREWSISWDELQHYYAMIDRRLSSDDDTLQTGPNCPKCYGASICPAYREASMNAIDATSVYFNDDLAPEQISSELDLLEQANDVIEGRLKALQELAQHKIAQGTVIPMYGLESQIGQRRFKKAFDAATIRLLTGLPCTKETLVTPAELERRGVSKDVLNLITERPHTGQKLVRSDSDTRARRLLNRSN